MTNPRGAAAILSLDKLWVGIGYRYLINFVNHCQILIFSIILKKEFKISKYNLSLYFVLWSCGTLLANNLAKVTQLYVTTFEPLDQWNTRVLTYGKTFFRFLAIFFLSLLKLMTFCAFVYPLKSANLFGQNLNMKPKRYDQVAQIRTWQTDWLK